jgi:integrase
MSSTFKFTQKSIEGLPRPEQARIYFMDEKEPRLGVYVTKTGVRSFFVKAVIDRQTRRIVLGKFPQLSVALARDKTREVLASVARGINPVSEKRRKKTMAITLRAVLDDYLATKKLKPLTVADYHKAMAETFGEYLDKPLASITEQIVRRRYVERGKKSPARTDLARRVLGALFNYARDRYKTPDGDSCFPHNPTVIISDLKIGFKIPRRRRVIERDQLPVWWETVSSLEPRQRIYLTFLLLTGARRAESLGLQWEDVDLDRAIFTLRETKNGTDATLPLPTTVVSMLRPYQADTGPVFDKVGGVQSLVNKVKRRSGIEFSVHDLRRTFVSTANGIDVNFYTVKHLVNHAISAADVTAGYDVPNIDRLRTASRKIEAEFLRQAGKLDADVIPLVQ